MEKRMILCSMAVLALLLHGTTAVPLPSGVPDPCTEDNKNHSADDRNMETTVLAKIAVFLSLFTLCRSVPVAEVQVPQSSIVNDRPIIGVALQETNGSKYGDTFVLATYVKYLEQAGARVVAVRAGKPLKYYTNLFSKINGLLFPGGEVSLTTSQYARTGRIMYNLTLQAADNGDMFPLWGTCLGFQLLNNITAGRDVLTVTNTENVTLPLDFVPGFETSRLFSKAPEEIVQYLQNEPVTQNQHTYSVLVDDFNNNPKLKNFYRVLSTNVGNNGAKFISTFEAYKYPIYGTQWHPEKNAFNWNPHYVINHSAHAIRVAQYFANFFVSQARLSSHRFPSVENESAALIHNYDPVYSTDGTFYETYFLNFTQSAVANND